ncbi:regulatory sensor-transducer, BlaR1/MecR1 family / TonB-dependent receptor [Formosa agariphila KMM 3901]|uniref:Regulatory sensor-transducer, BlaR1/MecR1 family / TonB-dependent receptor n=1 Tax=Formosa agariphila (strain DSM 15362 / KCTC 12365 / LMG 23005 / KMM 3901 / M-2Alg 35-1) TaxID=1347342 RepID=T2KS01_FORAG|nr:M56 family metallopeptidase [Formosa agariphila]CDF80864.1 regulatory sensor-transducer, BlaR1/MecR1 family / TonB-dependent receptor [Formosa agariphila KMM 3901]
MLHYILQTIAFQLFFLMVYDLFLKRETFFNWNRFYLLFTPIASLVLPLIKIEAFRNVLPQNYIVQLPAVILNPDASTVQTQLLPTVYLKNSSSFWSWEFILYVGIYVSAFIFIFKMFKLFKTINISEKNTASGLTIITLKNSSAAFSFFNYVFLGDAINPKNYQTILAHECVHKSQKHSADLLFFELLRILFWFNPLVYMYQNRMVTLHEYIADALVVKQQDKVTYYQNLLSQVFDVNHISFINPFFKQSLIKKRIIMLTKSKSKQIHLLKYAMLIPMVFAMLLYTSCDKEADNSESTEIQTSKDKIQEKIDKIMEENPNVKIKIIEEDSVIDDDIEVPYSVVEQVPIFPGCEDLPAAEQKGCFSGEISKFVGQNYNIDLATTLGLSGRQRINVLFKIDKSGNITGVRARAPHPKLEEEAIRVINELPKMIPGEQKGIAVTVPYSLPIVFEIKE